MNERLTYYSINLRVFENRVVKEETGHRRKLHNEELHNLYPSRSTILERQIKRDEMGGQVTPMGEMMNTYKI
jgi:hypothetical protein